MDDAYRNDVIYLLNKVSQTTLIQDYYHELSDVDLYKDRPLVVSRKVKYDLVELDNNNTIKKVYVVCTYSEFLDKLNALLKQLNTIYRYTKAEVYLTFVDDLDKLQIMSLKQIKAKCKKKTHIVKSFSEFYEALNDIQIIVRLVTENVNRFFYRGQANNEYEPIPSIFRAANFLREDRYYREAVRRLPHEFTEDMSTFDNLVKMQHYELPTRLLDITTNPLVALFFACQESKNKGGKETNGEVLIFPLPEENIDFYDSDSVSLLANLAKRPIGFDFDKEKDLLISDVQKDRKSYNGSSLKKADLNKILCVLPKLNNARIINQNGAFFIFGMGKEKTVIPNYPERPFIINVHADSKKSILKELEQFGINEASLFPETNKIMHQIKKEMQQSVDDEYNLEAAQKRSKAIFDGFRRISKMLSSGVSIEEITKTNDS